MMRVNPSLLRYYASGEAMAIYQHTRSRNGEDDGWMEGFYSLSEAAILGV